MIVLERIIRNVDLLNQSLEELSRSVHQINQHNQNTVVASNLLESVSVLADQCICRPRVRGGRL